MKMSQIHTEIDKNLKNFHFSKILRSFRQILTDFVDSNVLKSQQGKIWLSSSFFRKVFCVFLNENVSNCHRKPQKIQNFSIFKDFLHLFPIFDELRQLEC